MGIVRGDLMMEGLLFYLLFWIGWIITTFFYPKTHPDRLKLSVWFLVTILFSTFNFNLFEFTLSGSGAFILFTAYLSIVQFEKKQILYLLLTSFIIVIAYVCFLLFELFDPIWIIMKREWMLSLLISYLAIFLHSEKKQRILVILIGMIQGDMFYAQIIRKYSFHYPSVTLSFLDALALTFAIILVWNGFEMIAKYYDKYFQTEEMEKPKY
jgi:hypothetical protein